jgi:hypothetical protein
LSRRQTFSLPLIAAAIAQKSNWGEPSETPLTLLGQEVPPRKFELGQTIFYQWDEDVENGFRAAVDKGIIVGYWWNATKRSVNFQDWYKQEWVYVVAYFDCQSSDSQHCPFLDIGGESELELALF